MPAPTRRALVLIAAAVLGAAAVVLLLVTRSGPVEGSAVPAPPVTSTTERPCSNEVTIFVKTDEEMRRVADTLRGDARIGGLNTETKQQAFERFKVVFKDQPELLKLARVEAMPASVRVTPAGRMPVTELGRQLKAEFPGADEVRTVLPC